MPVTVTTKFEVPKGVVAGNAKVSVELPAGGMPIELTTAEVVVPVVTLPHESDAVR